MRLRSIDDIFSQHGKVKPLVFMADDDRIVTAHGGCGGQGSVYCLLEKLALEAASLPPAADGTG